MRKLFIPLLAVLALLTAVNAETCYLFASHARGTHLIHTVSKEAREISGEIFGIKKIKIGQDLNLAHQHIYV